MNERLLALSGEFLRLSEEGQHVEALEVALAALALSRQNPDDEVTQAGCLSNVGTALRGLDDLVHAAEYLQQARDLLRADPARFETVKPEYATCTNNLASVRRAMGRLLEAKGLYEEALAVRRDIAVDPDQDPVVAEAMDNLGTVLHDLADNNAALDLHREALRMRRSTHGRSHPVVAQSLNNLGCLFWDMGRHHDAASCLEESLRIREKRLRPDHPDRAETLENLGIVNMALADDDKAESLLRMALAIRESEPGRGLAVARTLGLLASVLRVKVAHGGHPMDEATKREIFDLEARSLAARKAILGDEHPAVALSLRGLAYTAQDLDDHRTAEQMFTNALQIEQAALGASHPEVASDLMGRGLVRLSLGDLGHAETDLAHAREILVKPPGGRPENLSVVLTHLAQLYVGTGRDLEALRSYRESIAIDDETIGQVFVIGSQAQRAAYLDALRWKHSLFLHFVRTHEQLPECVHAGLQLVLRRKAIESEMLAAERSAVLRGRHPELASELRDLFQLRAQIARKVLDGPMGGDEHEYRRTLAEWQDERDRREAALAQRIPELATERAARHAEVAQVAGLMPVGSALVEVVRTRALEPGTLGAPAEDCYLAFVLRADDPDTPALVYLGPAAIVDHAANSFRDLMSRWQQVAAAEISTARRRLCELVIDPLLPELGNRKHLLISPDGALQLIPFALLETGNGTYLIDRYRIDYLGSGRDLIRFLAPHATPAEPLVVAAPDYDLSGAPCAGSEATADKSIEGFVVEGKIVAGLLRAEAWFGRDALKERLLRVRSPQILHIATHGYIEEPSGERTEYPPRVTSELTTQQTRVGWYPVDNPLLHSGLKLAGANTWAIGGTPAQDAGDGVLTAEDVTGMDLLDTDLVVLSACDTGRGQVRGGEGVMGLRHAFTVAGARMLIMSLFQVPEGPTVKLMELFYTYARDGRGGGHISYAEAFRKAQLAFRKEFPDEPSFWGFFIFQGDPGGSSTTVINAQ